MSKLVEYFTNMTNVLSRTEMKQIVAGLGGSCGNPGAMDSRCLTCETSNGKESWCRSDDITIEEPTPLCQCIYGMSCGVTGAWAATFGCGCDNN